MDGIFSLTADFYTYEKTEPVKNVSIRFKIMQQDTQARSSPSSMSLKYSSIAIACTLREKVYIDV